MGHTLQNTWDRSWVWQISGLSHADEVCEEFHLFLSWPEFLEAIARLVGLLSARKRKLTQDDIDKVDYGLSFCSPSYAFCIDNSKLFNRKNFSEILDTFLRQDTLKLAARDRVSKGPLRRTQGS